MKKTAIIVIIFAVTAGMVRAQDTFSLGIGVEADGYSSNQLLAAAPVFTLDYRFNEMWSLGARGLYAIDLGAKQLGDSTVLELDATVRWYFLRWKDLVDYYFMWQNKYHFFAQLDIGLVNVFNEPIKNIGGIAPNIGAELGVRIMFDNVYVEPYARLSMQPADSSLGMTWGIGAIIGYTFHSNRGGY